MNIILFQESELNGFLPISDYRAQHILNILHCVAGDSVEVGIINGVKGTATIRSIDHEQIVFDFHMTEEQSDLFPISVVIGHPRPQSLRRILRDLTTLGVSEMHFPRTEMSEKSYLKSSIWLQQEYLRFIREGVEQSSFTRFPEAKVHHSLKRCLDQISLAPDRIALDNDVFSLNLSQYEVESTNNPHHPDAGSIIDRTETAGQPRIIIAVGPDRGWSDSERLLLKDRGFTMASLGKRILRTDTACIAGVTLLLERFGYI